MATATMAQTALEPVFPRRLAAFLTKYPPQLFSSHYTGQKISTLKQRIAFDAKPLSATSLTQESAPVHEGASTDTTPRKRFPPNPFLPYKNPGTGRWRGARYGLRQQADLCKLARQYGIEELLPPSIKSADYKQRRALERGLQVKGTGEGQRVKGHKWERTMSSTIEKRRKAMEEMPEMIRKWQTQGHGRGWKKFPK